MTFAFRALQAAGSHNASQPANVTYRASASTSGNTSSTALAIPSDIFVDDVMVLVVGWSISSGQTFTSPSGWAALGNDIDDQSQIASKAFYRKVQAGDGGTAIPIVLSATGNITALLSCYGNVDTTTPVEASAGAAEDATVQTTHSAPSVTSLSANDYIVSAVVDKASPASSTWTPPSGTTKRTDSYNTSDPGVTGAIGDDLQISVGGSGGRTWTADSSTARAVMWTFALKPGAANGSTGGSNPNTDILIFGAGETSGAQAIMTSGGLDQRLATSVSKSAPFLDGYHAYSGNSFPSTFAGSNAYVGYTYGYTKSVLNVKCDWTSLSNGDIDSTITSFVNSIPTDHKVYLLINHEPENDNNPAGHGAWQSGQARAANLISSLNDPRCYFGICLMTYTWDVGSGKNPQDWDPTTGMTQAALGRTVFAPDGYTKARNSSGTSIDTMASEFASCFAGGSSWGFTRFGISEHALNNDIGAPISALVNWWQSDHFPYLRNLTGLEYYAIYNHTGPASGTNSYIDTVAEETNMANFVLEQQVS